MLDGNFWKLFASVDWSVKGTNVGMPFSTAVSAMVSDDVKAGLVGRKWFDGLIGKVMNIG